MSINIPTWIDRHAHIEAIWGYVCPKGVLRTTAQNAFIKCFAGWTIHS